MGGGLIHIYDTYTSWHGLMGVRVRGAVVYCNMCGNDE